MKMRGSERRILRFWCRRYLAAWLGKLRIGPETHAPSKEIPDFLRSCKKFTHLRLPLPLMGFTLQS